MAYHLALALAATALVAAAGSAVAKDCGDLEDQAAMNACFEKAYADADKVLNTRFREIEHRLADDADARKLIVSAQRAWVAFRDAECAFSSSAASGGSFYPAAQAMCLDDLTRARNAQLGTYLSCEEGDTTCPVPPAE